MNSEPGVRFLDKPEPTALAVVVIARNEEEHIEKCLDSLMLALHGYPNTPVLLVDSGSTDRTVPIAMGYPVDIYRYSGPPYSAAAGRRVGFERTKAGYVLFVDSDCCMQPCWIERALHRLGCDTDAGVIYGQRREVYEGGTERMGGAAPAPEEYGLGGNALYRADALREAGGFNPYLIASEEGELLGRIIRCGYHAVSTDDVMFVHYTLAKTSVAGFLRRFRRGLHRGNGQTLRAAAGQGTFLYHLRRLNRYPMTLAYLLAGLGSAIAAIVFRQPVPLAVWALLGFLAFMLIWYRRRSLRSAAFIVADWVAVAIHLPFDFLRRPQSVQDFKPTVEHLRRESQQHSGAIDSWV